MPVVPDPKWLEILKASGWQTAALASAFGGFLLLNWLGWLPPLDAWMIQLATFGALVCGLLALASMGNALIRFFPIHIWISHSLKRRQRAKAVKDYIPHMTAEERKIVGYLLSKNQKMFTMSADGGYAVTLISKGVIVWATSPGQMYSQEDVPAGIPDYAWEVLTKHRDQFPESFGPKEPHPWRVPWMAR